MPGDRALWRRIRPVIGFQNLPAPAGNLRTAQLEVHAGTREIFSAHNNGPMHVPRSLVLHFVDVRELDPPEGEPPVRWRLVTTEPIETSEQIAAVIDAYRQRWIIEEFFKALKTGCRYRQQQLESARTLLIALAIETAIAWRMLLLRWLTHHKPEAPAITVIPREQLTVLTAHVLHEQGRVLPPQLNVQTAMYESAALGGHIKNNGPPGWILLRRGLDKLLTIHRGWSLAHTGPRQHVIND